MTDLEYLIVLNSIPEIGYIRFKNLVERFGGAGGIFKATQSELEKVEKIGPKISSAIVGCDKEKTLEHELKLVKRYGVKVMSCIDKEYPQNLREIYDPPLLLYVKGDIVPEDKFAVAIVGSRRASRYGIRTAERLGYELAIRGITVVSGLARGVDAAGHKGALKAKGRTIAVLGNGLAEIYPPEHAKLAEDISASGAVISEFPIEMGPLKENFPRRNRIISGFSLGVVVVEAAKNSGALITADFALEQGRELFSVPGPARVTTSQGTNMLIRQGAKLVESADDVIEELDEVIKGHLNSAAKGKREGLSATVDLDESERKVFGTINDEPKAADDIVCETTLPIKDVLKCVTGLRLKGLIEQTPGMRYVRK